MQYKVGDRVRYIGGAYTDLGAGLGEVSGIKKGSAHPFRVQFEGVDVRPCRADELVLIEVVVDPEVLGPYTQYEVLGDGGGLIARTDDLASCMTYAIHQGAKHPDDVLDVVKATTTHLYAIRGNKIAAYPQTGAVQ